MNDPQQFPTFLGLVAGLVIHARNAGILYLDAAQRAGHTKKLLARLHNATPTDPRAAAQALSIALQIELLEPVTKCLHQATVEGVDRDELFKRCANLGQACAQRLFLDREAVH